MRHRSIILTHVQYSEVQYEVRAVGKTNSNRQNAETGTRSKKVGSICDAGKGTKNRGEC
jgi:hypothetical protein